MQILSLNLATGVARWNCHQGRTRRLIRDPPEGENGEIDMKNFMIGWLRNHEFDQDDLAVSDDSEDGMEEDDTMAF